MVYSSAITQRASRTLLLLASILSLQVTAGECKGTVYLTFDTGNMDHAVFIARTLEQRQIRATFFLANTPTRRGGHALDDSWKAYWQARVAAGHSFGNHTWSHHYIKSEIKPGLVAATDTRGKRVTLDAKQYCQELQKVARRFERLTGNKLQSMWRAPGGKTTGQTLRWANDCGYPVHVGWDPAGYIGDDKPVSHASNERLLANALESIRNGDILLLHLGIWSRKTPLAPALPRLIDGLRKKDFCFDVLQAGKR